MVSLKKVLSKICIELNNLTTKVNNIEYREYQYGPSGITSPWTFSGGQSRDIEITTTPPSGWQNVYPIGYNLANSATGGVNVSGCNVFGWFVDNDANPTKTTIKICNNSSSTAKIQITIRMLQKKIS